MEYDAFARIGDFCERNRCSYVITTAQYRKLCEAIERVLQVYEKEIFLESTFETDLGADSIDLAQIFRLVEQETGNAIPPTDVNAIKTVEDALLIVVKSSPYQKREAQA